MNSSYVGSSDLTAESLSSTDGVALPATPYEEELAAAREVVSSAFLMGADDPLVPPRGVPRTLKER